MDLLVETDIQCPHCGEDFGIVIDTSQSDALFVEDCTVCCRPMELEIECRPGVVVDVRVGRG